VRNGTFEGRWSAVDDDSLEALKSEFFEEGSQRQKLSIVPDFEPGSFAVWRQQSPDDRGITAFGLMAPASVGDLSEDAPPMFGYERNSDGVTRAAAAVFDGMGGAGSRIISDPEFFELKPGMRVSKAYLASRVARREFEDVWWSSPRGIVEGELLRERFSTALDNTHSRLGSGAEGRLSGSMVRHLPTTFASVQCEQVNQRDQREWIAEASWAGDSRAFLLTPRAGLQQLTSDDVDEPDPLEQLRGDHPLRNALDASKRFKVNSNRVPVNSPALLVVATDGLFHYLPTPGSLEYHLLATLRDSEFRTAAELIKITRAAANDDVSFVVVALGFSRFSELRLAFRSREAELRSAGYSQLLSMAPGDSATLLRANQLWQRERERYVELMEQS
jgi:serine/threonine protein phosphatase PrpC